MAFSKSHHVLRETVCCFVKEPVIVRFFHRNFRCCKCLTPETVNPNYKGLEYAITGPILQQAIQIEREIQQVKTDIVIMNK